MHGPITLAGYTFTPDEWSKVEADLCDVDQAGNDQADAVELVATPANDNGGGDS